MRVPDSMNRLTEPAVKNSCGATARPKNMSSLA
jgi:hypothetical protein